MYFITKRMSETGKKFQVIEEKVDRIHKQQIALSFELGFEQWRGHGLYVFGGFSSLVFTEQPDLKIYKLVLHPNEYMPKRNSKKGKEVDEKLNAGEVVHRKELNDCVGLNSSFTKCIGYALNNSEYFGFKVKEEWDFTPPADCEEVTSMRYNELFSTIAE
jgi:hypothetical protein